MNTRQFQQGRTWQRRIGISFGLVLLVLLLALAGVWYFYEHNLRPLSQHAVTKSIVITAGSSTTQIADELHSQHIIRNAWTFERYIQSKGVGQYLQAGTYSLSPSEGVQDIVAQLTHGKVVTQLITILPGQRLDQVRQSLINSGFSKSDVDAALVPASYEGNAALVDKPIGNSLEGYLYPDSFQRSANTTAKTIVQESIAEMQKHLTPDIRAAFAKEGLSTYQGIILASIVQQEVNTQSDRNQVAQVFLTRMAQNMSLGSDITAMYGSRLAGQGKSLTYDTPYNTLIHSGLPPGPVSNVNASALQAVAHPANTNWLYFVAGDDGTTYFSTTLDEHNQQTAQYCHKLCQ